MEATLLDIEVQFSLGYWGAVFTWLRAFCSSCKIVANFSMRSLVPSARAGAWSSDGGNILEKFVFFGDEILAFFVPWFGNFGFLCSREASLSQLVFVPVPHLTPGFRRRGLCGRWCNLLLGVRWWLSTPIHWGRFLTSLTESTCILTN